MTYLNARKAIVELLRLADVNAGTELDKEPATPFVYVAKFGGQRSSLFSVDRLNIQVVTDSWNTDEDGEELADSIMEMFLNGPHFVPGYGLIDSIEILSSTTQTPTINNLNKHIFDVAIQSRAS